MKMAYEIKLFSTEGNEKTFLVFDYVYIIDEKELRLFSSDKEVIGIFSTTKWGFFVSNKSEVTE